MGGHFVRCRLHTPKGAAAEIINDNFVEVGAVATVGYFNAAAKNVSFFY